MTVCARHQTNLCGWTCERSFASLTVHNLKVHIDWGLTVSISVCIVSLRRRKWQPTPIFLPGESHG